MDTYLFDPSSEACRSSAAKGIERAASNAGRSSFQTAVQALSFGQMGTSPADSSHAQVCVPSEAGVSCTQKTLKKVASGACPTYALAQQKKICPKKAASQGGPAHFPTDTYCKRAVPGRVRRPYLCAHLQLDGSSEPHSVGSSLGQPKQPSTFFRTNHSGGFHQVCKKERVSDELKYVTCF